MDVILYRICAFEVDELCTEMTLKTVKNKDEVLLFYNPCHSQAKSKSSPMLIFLINPCRLCSYSSRISLSVALHFFFDCLVCTK